MIELDSITKLPNVPAIYAMYGGDTRRYVAYVGIADVLKRRVMQHLVGRDSSVATGTSAVGINPDYIREVIWWEDERFSERDVLQAAELVAFDVLEPALRSRGAITNAATQLCGDALFREEMTTLFAGSPTGRLVLPTL